MFSISCFFTALNTSSTSELCKPAHIAKMLTIMIWKEKRTYKLLVTVKAEIFGGVIFSVFSKIGGSVAGNFR